MKKNLIIIVSIIIFIVIIFCVFSWIDYTKIIEKPLDILKDGQKGYKIEETDNTIILTIYTHTTPRIITTFNFNNNVYTNATFSKVYKSKIDAKNGLDEEYSIWHNRNLEGNVVSGDIQLNVSENKNDYFKILEDTYSKSCIKIE